MFSVKDLEEIKKYCLNELDTMGYHSLIFNDYNIVINNRLKKSLAQIKKIRNNVFQIDFNFYFLQSCPEQYIKNTMMHELIHSIDGCMNHGHTWKSIANKINCVYGYNVTTTTSYSEYNKVYKTIKNHTSYKYKVVCTHCNTYWRYKKQTRLTSALQNNLKHGYTCPYCKNGSFKLELI